MKAITGLFGGGKDKGAELAAREAAASQRRSLAQMAKDSATADAASNRTGGRKGRSLLSFLSAEGSSGLSAA